MHPAVDSIDTNCYQHKYYIIVIDPHFQVFSVSSSKVNSLISIYEAWCDICLLFPGLHLCRRNAVSPGFSSSHKAPNKLHTVSLLDNCTEPSEGRRRGSGSVHNSVDDLPKLPLAQRTFPTDLPPVPLNQGTVTFKGQSQNSISFRLVTMETAVIIPHPERCFACLLK